MNNTGLKFGGRKKGTPNKKTKLNFKNKNLSKFYKKKGLYFIECFNFYKIGYSSNLGQRLTILNNCNPIGINLINLIICEDPEKIEKELHEILKLKLIHAQEWFNLNQKDIFLIESLNLNNLDFIINELKKNNCLLF